MRAAILDERQRRQLIATSTVKNASNAADVAGQIAPMMSSISGDGSNVLDPQFDNLTQAVNALLTNTGGGISSGNVDGGSPDRRVGGIGSVNAGNPENR